MVLIPMLCPHCQSDQVTKGGTTQAGKQRYRCQNTDCSHYHRSRSKVNHGANPT